MSATRVRDPERNSGAVWRVLQVISGIGALWLLVPMLIVIPMSFTGSRSYRFPPESWSFRWYENIVTDDRWLSALGTSLLIAVIVAVVATTLGTAAALGLSRIRIRGAQVLNGLFLSPMILPVVIIGVAVYLVFLNFRLVNSPGGMVLAHTVLATPYVVVAVAASLRGFDTTLERAGASLGAAPLRVFLSVTLPIIRPGVLAGALFAFIASFDELVVSIFLVGPSVRTLPVQMFTSVAQESDPTVAAVSTILMVSTAIILLLVVLAQRSEPRRAP
ncbi:MAG TPA: ABC transporter permease [Pseudolysinimonas sp.]|nr:ABC transporter permease [Pseudolysinimonas sp.]